MGRHTAVEARPLAHRRRRRTVRDHHVVLPRRCQWHEAAALGQRATKDEALVAAFKALATEAALRTDAKTAVGFVESAMAITDRLQRERELGLKARAQATRDDQLRLAREKFEAAEKRLSAATKAVTDETLTDEQRVERIKGIFGVR
ncbi:MAG: hypothetical protein ACI4RA_05495 [Kiritimatiellia bacterium]